MLVTYVFLHTYLIISCKLPCIAFVKSLRVLTTFCSSGWLPLGGHLKREGLLRMSAPLLLAVVHYNMCILGTVFNAVTLAVIAMQTPKTLTWAELFFCHSKKSLKMLRSHTLLTDPSAHANMHRFRGPLCTVFTHTFFVNSRYVRSGSSQTESQRSSLAAVRCICSGKLQCFFPCILKI